MKSDIARQPLVPAFLTLLVLGGATAWSFAFADTSAAVVAADPAVGGLVLDMPARVVVDFQAARPGWARLLATLAFMLAALATGRMTLRHGLYGVSTCLAVPLAGLFMLGLLQGAGSLAVTTGALLLAYSTKNFARSFRNGYAFDALLRGGGYLGLLVVLFPATLPLAALLPFACLLFRRTLREAAVALFGAVLPLLLFAYVNWGPGGASPRRSRRWAGSSSATIWRRCGGCRWPHGSSPPFWRCSTRRPWRRCCATSTAWGRSRASFSCII